jgi:putative oxidoreductase|tara:strand:- start:656 stop:793 length:138 start_codon:yes stop_codon:yes gene_type:complete
MCQLALSGTTADLKRSLMWGLPALSVVIQGGGKFSVDRKTGREFQ